jgi:hypothetical protein
MNRSISPALSEEVYRHSLAPGAVLHVSSRVLGIPFDLLSEMAGMETVERPRFAKNPEPARLARQQQPGIASRARRVCQETA